MNELATFVHNAINANAVIVIRFVLQSLTVLAGLLAVLTVAACIQDKEFPPIGFIACLCVFCASTLYLIGGM